MATVMREPSQAKRRALLTAAYERGVRSFDVAPIYGLGAAESDLGWLIKQGVGDVRVTTKVGRRLPLRSGPLKRIQSPMRSIARAVPGVRSVMRRLVGASGVGDLRITAADLRTSVEESLERLGTDQLHRVVSHEVTWSDDWTEVWPEFEQIREHLGIQQVGVSGPMTLLNSYPDEVVGSASFLQVPFSDGTLGVAPAVGERNIARYSILSALKTRLEKVPLRDELIRGRWRAERLLGAGPQAIVVFALAAYRRFEPEADLIVGTSSASRVDYLCDGLELWAAEDGVRWDLVANDLAFDAENNR